MPFWVQVAFFLVLPSTAHAPAPPPGCDSTLPHKNSHLANQKHPVTGIPFNAKGYPIFESLMDVTIPEKLRDSDVSDTVHFTEATHQVREMLEISPGLEDLFTPEQLKAIKEGWPRLPGLTWHHHEDGETLQLVDRDVHARTGHVGGRASSGGRPR